MLMFLGIGHMIRATISDVGLWNLSAFTDFGDPLPPIFGVRLSLVLGISSLHWQYCNP